MTAAKHILVTGASLLLILGVPFFSSSYFSSLVKGEGADAVSSASVIIDQPSGNYVVVINLEKHRDSENLELWEKFFSGEDVSFIFEDIVCSVMDSDSGGIQMAESYMSRLPENQMKLKKEDPTLMLSKADNGKFDIIVMSEEMAQHFKADTVYSRENVTVLQVKGDNDEKV